MAEMVEQQLSINICYIPVEVVAEVVYVLSKIYNVERKILAQTVIAIIDTDKISVAHRHVVRHALGVFASSTFSFVDCLLIGYAEKDEYSVFTFDKKLRNYLNK